MESSRFIDLKGEIASSTSKEQLEASWADLLQELAKRTEEIAQAGADFIPQVNVDDLDKLTSDEINVIKRKGSVIIRGVVDPDQVNQWKIDLQDFVKRNPHVSGVPVNDVQFFHLHWTPAQIQARANPNVLKACTWLNKLYHFKSGKVVDGVDLSVPLTYADRFRIRRPGVKWYEHPPHIDGGTIELWEDPTFRRCFQDILTGNWRHHDPYDLEHRLEARCSLYGRPHQCSVLRTFQGWLALSEIAPTQGTLQIFPDLTLSNAYIMLRPFFRLIDPMPDPNILDLKNWEFDISTPDFPGIYPCDSGVGFAGPSPTTATHPHLMLDKTMISVPKVTPGDMVFWHCDVLHSVEEEHLGNHDSAVMYISSAPKTPQNERYIKEQLKCFSIGDNPPDFPRLKEGISYVGLGVESNIKEPVARVAMGLPPLVS